MLIISDYILQLSNETSMKKDNFYIIICEYNSIKH